MNEDQLKKSPCESGNAGSGSPQSRQAGPENPQEAAPASVPPLDGSERREDSPIVSPHMLQAAWQAEGQTLVLCYHHTDLPPGVGLGPDSAVAQGLLCSGSGQDGESQTLTIRFQCSELPEGA